MKCNLFYDLYYMVHGNIHIVCTYFWIAYSEFKHFIPFNYIFPKRVLSALNFCKKKSWESFWKSRAKTLMELPYCFKWTVPPQYSCPIFLFVYCLLQWLALVGYFTKGSSARKFYLNSFSDQFPPQLKFITPCTSI